MYYQWYMDNLFIGTTEHNSMSVLMWNLALDGNGDPELPSSSSCNPPCRPIGMLYHHSSGSGAHTCYHEVTISGSSYTVNQECKSFLIVPYPEALMFSLVYAMAQSAKAIVPKDVNGPFGQRIGVSVGGNLNWALRVGAYVTHRVNPSDWLRYSIVVLNW